MPEGLNLAQRVLADSRIENEDYVMRRVRVELACHTDNLCKLRHQLGLVLQSPRRIDEHQVEIFRLGFFNRFIDETGCIGACRLGEDRNPGPFPPDGQLFNRGSAERVPGHKQRLRALLLQLGRNLADRRRLAGAVYADK